MAPPISSTLPLVSSATSSNLTTTATNAGNGAGASSGSKGLTHDAEVDLNQISSPHELIGWVDSVLAKLETKFSRLEVDVLDRLDVLGKRIDSLETSMAELMDGAGAGGTSSSGPPTGSLMVASDQLPLPQ
ncbi:hypothetical protein CROQUDRAFT_92770 [Cronartium quercuum f. sp. fusiforme G11]|uniref:Heat shock factor binding protein 1 n=1 Tax=Cronartium quercuum f. sp. fusiforme G11 TaxID=708437 RepID=A0A9P6TBJ0_9BASI|nr:hypothetical protein CROQUDRAFT_92770 [Cronartium quercuum f. sp. fusiforme G11]